MIKAFIAIENTNAERIVHYFDEGTITRAKGHFDFKFKRFIQAADEFAREHKFLNTGIVYGVFLDHDDTINEMQFQNLSLLFTNPDQLRADLLRFYKDRSDILKRFGEKVALDTI